MLNLCGDVWSTEEPDCDGQNGGSVLRGQSSFQVEWSSRFPGGDLQPRAKPGSPGRSSHHRMEEATGLREVGTIPLFLDHTEDRAPDWRLATGGGDEESLFGCGHHEVPMGHPYGDALKAARCLRLKLRREAGAWGRVQVRVLGEVTLGECII